MFYTVFDALTNVFFFSELASRHSLRDRNFSFRKIPKSVENHFFDRNFPKFEDSRHTWNLHEELNTLVLFSPMIQEEEKENVRHGFLQFENEEVTKRIGLPPDIPDFKLALPQSTQLFDLKRPA